MQSSIVRLRFSLGLLGIALGALAAASPAPIPPAPPGAPSEPTLDGLIRSGLRDLHQGLYGRAQASFRAAAGRAPGDPEPLLFVAFTHWWRIVLEERDRGAAYPSFAAAVDETQRAGERRLEMTPGDLRAMAAVGAAHILRSHVEATRRNYFLAAQEARRGKRLLEKCLEQDPAMQAALFPMGALNYFADRVPALVKGIRFILFLPGGDARLGLSQLGAVASSSDYFRTDARLVLGLICASREERCYEEGMRHLKAALQENPGSPLIAAAIGDLQVRLGDYREAARTYEEALRGLSADADPDRARQRRWLRLGLAEACAADWRLDQAAALLEEETREVGEVPAAMARLRARVTGDLKDRQEATGAFQADGSPAGTGSEGTAARFLKGRALLIEGRYEEARDELAAAALGSSDAPPWMAGWIELYSGMAEEKIGNRRAARSHFRRASDIKKFRSAERGLLLLHDGDPSEARCGG